ncbi:MazG nucleotide pyrophosphohydrolase domain-containing protein [Vibrio campbellii]|uniref:MazG nucleotide pyrophosphohydrolase domain-containing protein n=1 Tax=Vibrio campbellii TaxID=680 RepID=UPI001E5C033E|nr:MazG nucleotide pyrophosphohydrolase domain-containing protein [Vibrio campbellii]MCC8255818.1 nucleotide pyrophosphohydrolase [Vibrio campbellii CAIM 333]
MDNNFSALLGELESIAEAKSKRDLEGTWFKGSDTYLQAMIDEVQEVRAEIITNRQCFIEDELGDLLWNFVCVLQHLELENKIDKRKVYQRVVQKYRDRVTERLPNETWEDVKKRQKSALLQEAKKNKA